jgi:tRNA (adenine57-N1/adenine58-N1)-methyltransferase catalytic subunit
MEHLSVSPSPFFYTPPTAEADGLAMLHLRRDSLLPIVLRASADDGYAEGGKTPIMDHSVDLMLQ